MSSVSQPSEFQSIKEALGREGHRLAFDTQQNRFVDITKKQAEKDPNRYISQLEKLHQQIKDFINKTDLTTQQIDELQAAFDERKNNLSGRFILWGSDQRDKGVKNLEALKKEVVRSQIDKLTQEKATVSNQLKQANTITEGLTNELKKVNQTVQQLLASQPRQGTVHTAEPTRIVEQQPQTTKVSPQPVPSTQPLPPPPPHSKGSSTTSTLKWCC